MNRNPVLGKYVVAVGALALVAVAFGATGAEARRGDDFREDWCREECHEARKVCERAAKAAFKACRSICEESVSAARREAAAMCESEGLEGKDCARLTRKLVAEALDGCKRDCAQVYKRARNVCHEERKECRIACVPPVDGECFMGCREEFGACRDALGECTEGCREKRSAAIEECKELIADTCDPEAFRECVHQARVESRQCAETCHEDFSCGADLRECVGECVDDGEPEPEPVE